MSQDSYEYECMRAELLGLPKPEKKPEPVKQVFDDDEEDDDDEIDGEVAKELQAGKENLNAVGGGMAELNSILSVTQKKLNSLKPNFGSLKDLFRHLSGDGESGVESKDTDTVKDEGDSSSEGTVAMTKKLAEASRGGSTLVHETESQVDKLDALVMKAEEAEMRMAHQNSQMRKVLH